MKRLSFLMILAALAFPLASCGGEEGEGEGDGGDGNGEETSQVEETAGANEAELASGETADAICCGGSCDAPAGYCCNDDGTCGGSHEELPVHTL